MNTNDQDAARCLLGRPPADASSVGGRRLSIAVSALMIVCAGCVSPYGERMKRLDRAYERGDMSREDYQRFSREAEEWDDKGMFDGW